MGIAPIGSSISQMPSSSVRNTSVLHFATSLTSFMSNSSELSLQCGFVGRTLFSAWLVATASLSRCMAAWMYSSCSSSDSTFALATMNHSSFQAKSHSIILISNDLLGLAEPRICPLPLSLASFLSLSSSCPHASSYIRLANRGVPLGCNTNLFLLCYRVSTTLIRACATSRNDRAHVSCFREDKALNHSLEAMYHDLGIDRACSMHGVVVGNLYASIGMRSVYFPELLAMLRCTSISARPCHPI
jgi:hypothetical protein